MYGPPTSAAFLGVTLSNYAQNYLNLFIASFMYFTYAIVVKQLIGVTNQILSAITALQNDTAISGATKAISQSYIGRSYEKLTGLETIEKKINRMAPINDSIYSDNVEGRVLKSAKIAKHLVSSMLKRKTGPIDQPHSVSSSNTGNNGHSDPLHLAGSSPGSTHDGDKKIKDAPHIDDHSIKRNIK